MENYTDNVARWVETPLALDAESVTKIAAEKLLLTKAKEQLKAAKDQHDNGTPASLEELNGIVIDDTEATRVGNWQESKRYPNYLGKGYLHDDNKEKGNLTLTFSPKIPTAGRYTVRLAWQGRDARATNVPITVLHANGEATLTVDQTATQEDGRFITLGTWKFEANGSGFVLLATTGTHGFVSADAVLFTPEGQPHVKQTKTKKKTTQIAELEAYIKKLEKDAQAQPVVMGVREAPKPEDAQIRIRGQVHQKGRTVPRGFLEISKDYATNIPTTASGRLELAQWLTSPRNPLTARVFVNRVWAWLMGQGIVPTVDNFGLTGSPPTNQALLDWLAVSFMENNWSMRWLVKTIATSQAFRTAHTNQNARRLEAEHIRDAILRLSGTLDCRLLGPNINGASAIDANNTSAQNVEYQYTFHDTRRSLYSPAFRNRRPDLFEVFDFASNNTTQAQRNSSTVAQQALFLLNSPWIAEQAKAIAHNISQPPAPTSTAEKIQLLWKTALSRPPHPTELQASTKALSNAKEPYGKDAWATLCEALLASHDFRMLY